MSSLDDSIDRSISDALDYLLALQAAEGSWSDWDLPPGSSSVWTTAYVGCKLQCLPAHLKAKAAGPIAAASQYVLEHQFADGGWGYNTLAGSDADSTSFAILLLSYA